MVNASIQAGNLTLDPADQYVYITDGAQVRLGRSSEPVFTERDLKYLEERIVAAASLSSVRAPAVTPAPILRPSISAEPTGAASSLPDSLGQGSGKRIRILYGILIILGCFLGGAMVSATLVYFRNRDRPAPQHPGLYGSVSYSPLDEYVPPRLSNSAPPPHIARIRAGNAASQA